MILGPEVFLATEVNRPRGYISSRNPNSPAAEGLLASPDLTLQLSVKINLNDCVIDPRQGQDSNDREQRDAEGSQSPGHTEFEEDDKQEGEQRIVTPIQVRLDC